MRKKGTFLFLKKKALNTKPPKHDSKLSFYPFEPEFKVCILALLFLWIYTTVVRHWGADFDVSVADVNSRLKIQLLQICYCPGVKAACQAEEATLD